MARDGHHPRTEKLVVLKLTCEHCTATVTSRLPPSPSVDEGWPNHRCIRNQIRPFTDSEPGTLESNNYRPKLL